MAPILIISGSNRPDSNTLKIARIIERHYQDLDLPVELYSLEQMPADVFTPQAYVTKPDAFVEVQRRVVVAPGLHVVTPEYNGSCPGVLKHFIALLQCPESCESKPVAFVGIAAGGWGGLRAVEQLQMVFGYRHAHVYPERVFVPNVSDELDVQGNLVDPELNARLSRQAAGFARYTNLFHPVV